jgi:hypothetical protein
LDQSKNGAIVELIQSVVVEEMLHMTLVCNILNALGGAPVLDTASVIPDYPGPLPGGIENQLTVGLAPFSLDLVKNVFMEIEEPENPIIFPVVAREAAAVEPPETIGQFYDLIKQQIIALGDEAFCSTPRNQIGPRMMHDAVIVTNVQTAVKAITIIVEQGEGTPESPEEGIGHDFAHYYRFAEVVNGRRLIPNPNPPPHPEPKDRYVYGGAPIVLDPTGVYAVPTNPTVDLYPAGSAARRAVTTFNYTYTSLLETLHLMVNGQPERLVATIGLMMSLKQQAKDMMSGATTGGQSVGPSFIYQPTNP